MYQVEYGLSTVYTVASIFLDYPLMSHYNHAVTSTAIVITTINKPTQAVIDFSKLKGYTLYVAGDNKTPKNWKLNNAEFLSIEEQKKKYPRLAKKITENHYSRKNLAYLEAIKAGHTLIYETDDDNLPYNNFPNFLTNETEINEVTAPTSFNIYQLFTKENVWPRGIPLNHINTPVKKITKKKIKPFIQQSLADLDPDVDAIYRLTNGKEIKFKKNLMYSLAKGTYCPFNSQNTLWSYEVFPLLYLPSSIDARVTDIWRGYIAQRILWEVKSRVIFTSPSVYQIRNIHNFMKDFQQELDLYLKTEALISKLESLDLNGTQAEMLLTVYKALVTDGFFQKEELATLNEWLTYFE